MAAISTTRTAIKTAVANVVRCYDFMPEQPSFPCAIVGWPSSYDVNDTLSDTATMVLPLSVYVPYGANRAAEDKLESYLASSGAGSVIAAVEGIGSTYAVTAVRDFGVLETSQGQPAALGCVVEITVFA